MIKNILFVLFLFCTSLSFSQNKVSKTTESPNVVTINKNRTPKLIAFDKIESNKNNNSILNDTIPKPELKSFAVFQLKSNSKKNDSIIISEPELIPYTGYKKENDN